MKLLSPTSTHNYRKTSNIIRTFLTIKLPGKSGVRIILGLDIFCSLFQIEQSSKTVKLLIIEILVVLLQCNNEWMNRPTNGWMDQGGSVPLVHIAALTGRVCPPLPLPRPGRHSRDRRAGEMCELNATQRLTARQCGHSRPYACAIWLKWRRYDWSSGHPFVTATVLAGCSDQGHDFLTAAYDYVRSSSFLADILTSWVQMWGWVLYIGLQIFTLWQKSKVGVRIIFDGVLYLKFYGKSGQNSNSPTVISTMVCVHSVLLRVIWLCVDKQQWSMYC